ncbi:hypothetical protein ABE65_019595 [Fictibacillus phosphorivorans]|uniref:DUF975 family protein n=1 Tax=Fictibacillus phosphorivorans TaxID=1221500 RepID=A0A160IR29_9BACL|nr:DUF975 family protein [Fictibacillus phosphorivorans]ANC78884.1 hypothetical protein ABE65_019595 [Fictibacillus phosphorivorans]
MKNKEIKQQARLQLKGQWGTAAFFTLLFSSIFYLIPLIIEVNLSGGWSAWLNQPADELNGPTTSTFIITLVLLPLYIGYLWTFLSLIRTGEKINVSSLFQAFSEISTYIKILGTYLVMMVYLILWSLLLLIPGIIKAFSYSQTYFVLKDHPDIGINAAIKKSRKLMDGYKWKFFVLQLSFLGWGILCILSLGIGFFWLAPYMSASYAAFYNNLVNKHQAE